jgi:hypothetical protein
MYIIKYVMSMDIFPYCDALRLLFKNSDHTKLSYLIGTSEIFLRLASSL